MDSKQVADRAQFRRYAEAALSGMTEAARPFDNVAEEAFAQAAAMMLFESRYWEQYQLLALEAITSEERARHEQGS